MFNDDTRGIECPERPVDSSPTTPRLLTDGGTNHDSSTDTDSATTDETDSREPTPSKYVVPTGPGYLARYTIDNAGKVTISTAALGDRDWPTGTRVHATTHEDGVALLLTPEEYDAVAEYGITQSHSGARVAAGHDVVSELELEPGDDIRIYDLEAVDGREGLLIVDAENDPRLEAEDEIPPA